jgi:hypothetical protein
MAGNTLTPPAPGSLDPTLDGIAPVAGTVFPAAPVEGLAPASYAPTAPMGGLAPATAESRYQPPQPNRINPKEWNQVVSDLMKNHHGLQGWQYFSQRYGYPQDTAQKFFGELQGMGLISQDTRKGNMYTVITPDHLARQQRVAPRLARTALRQFGPSFVRDWTLGQTRLAHLAEDEPPQEPKHPIPQPRANGWFIMDAEAPDMERGLTETEARLLQMQTDEKRQRRAFARETGQDPDATGQNDNDGSRQGRPRGRGRDDDTSRGRPRDNRPTNDRPPREGRRRADRPDAGTGTDTQPQRPNVDASGEDDRELTLTESLRFALHYTAMPKGRNQAQAETMSPDSLIAAGVPPEHVQDVFLRMQAMGVLAAAHKYGGGEAVNHAKLQEILQRANHNKAPEPTAADTAPNNTGDAQPSATQTPDTAPADTVPTPEPASTEAQPDSGDQEAQPDTSAEGPRIITDPADIPPEYQHLVAPHKLGELTALVKAAGAAARSNYEEGKGKGWQMLSNDEKAEGRRQRHEAEQQVVTRYAHENGVPEMIPAILTALNRLPRKPNRQ